jgi:hypothetical protein
MGLAAGQIALDTDFAQVSAASNLKPVVQVYLSGTQSLTDNTLTALSFGAENFDSHGFHSTSVNPTRITPTVAGIYRCSGFLYLPGITTITSVRVVMRMNGATQMAPSAQWGNQANAVNHGYFVQAMLSFNGTTDYVEMCALQDNTANAAQNAQASTPNITLFEMEYLRAPI